MSPSLQTMGFFMSDINFCNTKEQLNHLGEVVTGKVDGSPTGADIDTSTLPYTGQVRNTLPALEELYLGEINEFIQESDQVITDKTDELDAAVDSFIQESNQVISDKTDEFDTSIANKEAEASAAIDSYRLLSKGDYAPGILLSNKFEFIEYNGESYFATNPPYTTTATTPDADGNLFISGYTTFENVANKIGNTNLLSNHNFINKSPDEITHPSVTPTDYVAGTQVFSGVFVGDDIVGLTYIDGRVSWTSGTLYFSVPNSGALEYVEQTDFVASVADFDGKPRTRGVSFALVGDEYRVTVGIDALSDGVDDTLLGSVKFEQGKVATGHGASYGVIASGSTTPRTLEDRFSDAVNVKDFGLVGDGVTDDYANFASLINFATSTGIKIVGNGNDTYLISDQIDLTGVNAEFSGATIMPDFDGKYAIVIGNGADISNLEVMPSINYRGNPDLGDSAPRDSSSHGIGVTGRSNLSNVFVRKFKGHGWVFNPVNMNSAQWYNIRAYENNIGFYFQTNTTDNISIIEASMYAYGNCNAGFFSNDGSNIRQNKWYIRSEFNNATSDITYGGAKYDVCFNDAVRNEFVIYSEGRGSASLNANIYMNPTSSLFNTVISARQDQDVISGSNLSQSGTRVWQGQDDGSTPIQEFVASNSNPNTLPLRVAFNRGLGTYGQILGKDGNLYLSNSNDDQLLGISDEGAIVGSHTVVGGRFDLTTVTPSTNIIITPSVANKGVAGKLIVSARSAGGLKRRYEIPFVVEGSTIDYGTASDILTGANQASYSTFAMNITGGNVVLSLSYQSGNLGGLYACRWEVEFSKIN